MDFVDWCGLVLDKLIDVSGTSMLARYEGADLPTLAHAIFGSPIGDWPNFAESTRGRGLRRAVWELDQFGAVAHVVMPDLRDTGRFRVVNSREGSTSLPKRWFWLSREELEPHEADLLRLINRYSQREAADHAWLELVPLDVLTAELGWPEGPELVQAVVDRLASDRLSTQWLLHEGRTVAHATYEGLVWDTRRDLTWESQWIDERVAEWETTSVDFKRDVETQTADQKAELIKDLLGLANTQASGQRWLLIGFDNETREYFGPPNPKLTQEHLEQLVARYTNPVLTVRYEMVGYWSGPVGKLEVIRESGKLPYRVAMSIGDKKRITVDQVFVRHGSLTEVPTPDELQAIRAEGDRARRVCGSP